MHLSIAGTRWINWRTYIGPRPMAPFLELISKNITIQLGNQNVRKAAVKLVELPRKQQMIVGRYAIEPMILYRVKNITSIWQPLGDHSLDLLELGLRRKQDYRISTQYFEYSSYANPLILT